MTGLPFSKRSRLLKAADFDAVFKAGRRFNVGPFTAVMSPNVVGIPRVGFALSKKHAPKSVQRNRIRRVLRERFRLAQHQLVAVDLVLMLRSKLPGAPAAATEAAITFWQELSRRCASS